MTGSTQVGVVHDRDGVGSVSRRSVGFFTSHLSYDTNKSVRLLQAHHFQLKINSLAGALNRHIRIRWQHLAPA